MIYIYSIMCIYIYIYYVLVRLKRKTGWRHGSVCIIICIQYAHVTLVAFPNRELHWYSTVLCRSSVSSSLECFIPTQQTSSVFCIRFPDIFFSWFTLTQCFSVFWTVLSNASWFFFRRLVSRQPLQKRISADVLFIFFIFLRCGPPKYFIPQHLALR